MNKIGIFYGSSTGNTEDTSNTLKDIFGDDASVFDVADAGTEDLDKFDNIILGASTTGIGEIQDDFDGFMSALEDANLENKTIAIFGYGDQSSFGDTFADSVGHIYNAIKDKGCKIIGKTSTEGYEYDDSEANLDGGFAGLILDDENQDDLTDERVEKWAEQIKSEFS